MNVRHRIDGGLIFIRFTVIVDGLAAGIIMPLMPQLLVNVTGQSVAHASIYGGFLLSTFSLIQFFAAPVLGNLSDQIGRRPVLLVSLVAIAVDYVGYAVAPTIHWLFVVDIVAGVLSATVSTALAYAADVTMPSERAREFGILSAALGIGFALGPMLVGLLEGLDIRTPLLIAATLAVLNAIYGYIALPESLCTERRRPFLRSRILPTYALMYLRDQKPLLRLLGCFGLAQISSLAIPLMWGYFSAIKFGWTQWEIGVSLSLYATVTLIAQGVLLGRVSERLSGLLAACVGFTCLTTGLFGCAFSIHSWSVLFFAMITGVGSLAGAALNSNMSASVPADAQGKLQGLIAAMTSVAAMIAPLLLTPLFREFASREAVLYFPGIPYFIAGLAAALGLLITIRESMERAQCPCE